MCNVTVRIGIMVIMQTHVLLFPWVKFTVMSCVNLFLSLSVRLSVCLSVPLYTSQNDVFVKMHSDVCYRIRSNDKII